MMPINTYKLIIEGYKDITWVLYATEEEIKKLTKKISKSVVEPKVSYEIIGEQEESEYTHILDGNGDVWVKTKINIYK